MKSLLLLLTVPLSGVCGQHNTTQGNELTMVQITQQSATIVPIQSDAAFQDIASANVNNAAIDHPDSQSLNDIRFGNWTEKDWCDNDYFRFLRQTLQDCLADKIEIDALTPYKSLLSSKFVVGNVTPAIFGGLFFSVIFIDAPDKVFSVNVYSHVDVDSKTITGYELRSISLNEEPSDLTKDEILNLVKAHPENKLW